MKRVAAVSILALITLAIIYAGNKCNPFETRLIAAPQYSVTVIMPAAGFDQFRVNLKEFARRNNFEISEPFGVSMDRLYQVELTRDDVNVIGNNALNEVEFDFHFYGPIRICGWGDEAVNTAVLRRLLDDFLLVLAEVPKAKVVDGPDV